MQPACHRRQNQKNRRLAWVFISRNGFIRRPFRNNPECFVGFPTNRLLEKIMNVENLDLGDVVYAAHAIVDDGSMPGSEEGEVLAKAGARGVIVMKGYLEDDSSRSVFLVRFEDDRQNLGRPVGCWKEDLTVLVS
jgi:nitrogen fixation protein NifZ